MNQASILLKNAPAPTIVGVNELSIPLAFARYSPYQPMSKPSRSFSPTRLPPTDSRIEPVSTMAAGSATTTLASHSHKTTLGEPRTLPRPVNAAPVADIFRDSLTEESERGQEVLNPNHPLRGPLAGRKRPIGLEAFELFV